MLDQETGLRGFWQPARKGSSSPMTTSGPGSSVRLAEAHGGVDGGEEDEKQAIADPDALAKRWQASAERAISARRGTGRSRSSVTDAIVRKDLMDRFRAANRGLQAVMAEEQSASRPPSAPRSASRWL